MKREVADGIEVPHTALSDEIFRAMLEEFVLREGTDYGDSEYTLDQKIEQVRKQVEKGKVKIIFSPGDETFDLVPVR